LRLQVDHPDPAINESRVTPGADVLTEPAATREHPVIFTLPADLQPGGAQRSKGVSV